MSTLAPSLPVEEQLAVIRRGSEKILPDEGVLRERLQRAATEQRPLRVKLGIDPTTSDLTLGHTIPLRNLRRFQDLGHTAVLVIGDYTATVGDPSGRSKGRPPLTHEQVLENAATYQEQAGKILDLERTEVLWNSDWLKRLTLKELIEIGSQVSVKRMLQGEYFGRRMDDPEQTVFLHEMFYPIMQGIDSVALHADVELGGTDQEFNCLMGRDMQRLRGQEPQVVVTSPLLLGLSGSDKMSKSLGNYVGVAWPAQEQFNKLMTLADDRMYEYFRLLTDVPLEEVDRKLAAVQRGDSDPRVVKKELVTRIVADLHGTEAAASAAEEYER
ncbi:MAG: tyrosine--tRNA ligase, partial [Chloroflexota bacterium]|nr:tyrosine--tRNA ligase [Chloroflexota bacterium]